MKIILIVLFAVLIRYVATADYWDIIKPFEKSHFLSTADSTIHSIDPIREYDTGDGIEFYNFYSNEITGGTVQNPTCVIEQGDGWFGRKVLMKNDCSQYFQNKGNELIKFNVNANTGDRWRLMRLKYGDYVEAELSGTKYKNIFADIYDSVKIIKLTVRDNQDKIVDSPINNVHFELSKHYGITSLFNIYYFPDSLLQYKLIGIESLGGIKPVTYKEVFDFQINDEFHIYEGDTSASNSGVLIWRRIKVTDKTFYPEKKILDYEVENKVMQVRFILDEYDTVYNDNFVHIHYDLNNYTNHLPEQSYIKYLANDTLLTSDYYFTGQYGGRQVICPWKIYERYIPPCYIKSNRLYDKHYFYIEGCGDYFEENYGYGQVWKRLVYYNKQGKEWGKPLDFVVGVNENSRQISIKLFSEILYDGEDLKFSFLNSGRCQYTISTLNGYNVINKFEPVNKGINYIKVQNLPAGVYFIKVQKGKQWFLGKFAIIE